VGRVAVSSNGLREGYLAAVRTLTAWQAGRIGIIIGAIVGAAGLVACSSSDVATSSASSPRATATATAGRTAAPTSSLTPTVGASGRRLDHVVVVVLENKASAQIDGSPAAPYLNSLMAGSAVLTQSRAVAHPSEPNYLALFSGSTHHITDDRCPLALGNQPNLGRQLIDAGLTFTGYSEGLPAVGFAGCSSGRYAAKHNPWNDFSNLPAAANQPASAFPSDFTRLPTVAFLIPDLCNDMHDCSVGTGDSWMRSHLDSYARWARDNNSLLMVTFDEDDNASDNHILTFVSGAAVRPGRYGQPIDHYGVLATIEDFYGLKRIASAATATPITGIWP
jgi:phosphatidylinositol-3-phosphatase